jgi:hypothetical protein
LRLVRGDRQLEAQLLVWKAQALLSMGSPERALPAASASWQLSPSPHACHLKATALNAAGDSDRAEELLGMGAELYPDAIYLPVQLAMMLADQGRMPEALEILDGLRRPCSFLTTCVFLVGLRANLLATVGRWPERDGAREGLDRHRAQPCCWRPSTPSASSNRQLAEEALVASWRDALALSRGRCGRGRRTRSSASARRSRSGPSSCSRQRLWRAFNDRESVRLVSEAWRRRSDGGHGESRFQPPQLPSVATACSASTARAALRRVRRYIDASTGFARGRSAPCPTAPRGERAPPPSSRDAVVRFRVDAVTSGIASCGAAEAPAPGGFLPAPPLLLEPPGDPRTFAAFPVT